MKRTILLILLTILIGIPVTPWAADVTLTPDGKVPGQPFEVLQGQINNLQGQINNIRLIPGPSGPQGPAGPPGPGGTLESFDELAGLACTTPGGQAGSLEVSYRSGVARLRCLVPGVRFMDNGDGTITDLLTGLMWEKKDGEDGVADLANPHDVDNQYMWDAAMGGDWLDRLNGRLIYTRDEGGFAGYSDWRLPTLAELRMILSAEYPNCPSAPCIDPIFGPTTSDPTGPAYYWSASSAVPTYAWRVNFNNGNALISYKDGTFHVRAVRGGP